MATLITHLADGTQRRTPVFKSLTTIGADPDSDVPLNADGVPQLAAHIMYDGKTFTIACAVAQLNRPTLVMSPNKTLAAQLYS